MGSVARLGVVGVFFALSFVRCVGDTTTTPTDASKDVTSNDVTQDSPYNDSGPADVDVDGNDGGLPPLTTQPMVAVGFGFSCVLRPTGKIYCWGNNNSGQLGNLLTGSPNPNAGQVANITTAARIVAGVDYACALLTDHHVSCWGANGTGALGQSPTPNNPTPTVMTSIDNVMELAGGSAHVCARKADNTVWCWGMNSADQLGYANTSDAACINNVLCNYKPTQVAGVSADQIAVGLAHSCARTGSTVKCWGGNGSGVLGHTPGQSGDLGSTNNYYNPTPVQASATGVGALFAGAGVTCMLDGTQKVSCWGNDNAGQLGDKGTAGQSSAPIAVPNMPAASFVAGSYQSTCAISASGPVYCWGDDTYGELGNGTSAQMLYNALVPTGLSNKTMVSISGSPIGEHWCALVNDGTVYCWGTNLSDELGHSNTSDATCAGSYKCSPTPVTVPNLP